jgi:hypothetical protein
MGQSAGCEKSSQSLRHRNELATHVRYSASARPRAAMAILSKAQSEALDEARRE